MSTLAKGSDDKALAEKLRKNFVFLNAYCTSVADEHEPRGPEGPFQFVDRSVPVYVIKSFEGKTFKQQLGFGRGAPATNALATDLRSALKQNGVVVAPKKLRPLMKVMKKADAMAAKKRPGYEWKALVQAVEMGRDKKTFPDGPPGLVIKAQARIDALKKTFDAALKKAQAAEPKQAKKSFATSSSNLRHGAEPEETSSDVPSRTSTPTDGFDRSRSHRTFACETMKEEAK